MGAREGRGSSDAPEPRLGKRWSRANPRAVAGVPLHPMRPDENRMRGPETKANHPPTQTGSKLQTHTHKRAHTLTPRRPTTARTHTRARALTQPQAQTSPEKSNTQKCPLPHCPLLPPSSVLFSKTKNKNLATTQQRTVRTFE